MLCRGKYVCRDAAIITIMAILKTIIFISSKRLCNAIVVRQCVVREEGGA